MVIETPDGGIQPQAAIDAKGVIHLIYFQGLPSSGDLFYARLGTKRNSVLAADPGQQPARRRHRDGDDPWRPDRPGQSGAESTSPGTARSTPCPRTPRMALPMLYARSNLGGTAFEPQRNLMRRTTALDGGGTIAADGEGNVYVGWHGRSEGAPAGEAGRRMWLTHSEDEGATFPPEEPAWDRQTGACACCGTRGLADRQGTVYILYRAATNGDERDMYLLTSNDRAGHFRGEAIHPWKLNACPMSSASLAEAGSGCTCRLGDEGQVYFRRIDPEYQRTITPPVAPPGKSGTANTRPSPSNAREARRSWSGPRGPAGRKAERWHGRCSIGLGVPNGEQGGSRAGCQSGDCRPSSLDPMESSPSFGDLQWPQVTTTLRSRHRP